MPGGQSAQRRGAGGAGVGGGSIFQFGNNGCTEEECIAGYVKHALRLRNLFIIRG